MRYAIISDIHANKTALKAVLTDAHDFNANEIICLGDILGYGPEPVEALELIYREAHVCLAGNHDDAVSSRFPVEDFTDFAVLSIEKHKKLLTREALNWLRHLPYSCTKKNFACAHGDFSDPKNFNYILSSDDAIPSWEETKEPLLFVGHTHEPAIFALLEDGTTKQLQAQDFTLEKGVRYIVNPGSVGYPRHGICRSSYCIYDDVENKVYFRSLPFDLESYRIKMSGKGMEEAPWLNERTKERRRPSVRNNVSFGKEIIPATKIEKKKNRPLSNFLPTILIALSIFLVFTSLIISKLSKSTSALPQVNFPQESPSVITQRVERQSIQLHTIPLANGWQAGHEDAASQKVHIDRNYVKDETVWCIEHKKLSTTHFSKTIPVKSGEEKIYTNIRLLTKRDNRKQDGFRFTSKLIFRDENGNIINEEYESGKTSKKSSKRIPSQSTSIEFIISCTCIGKYDLAIPYFDFKEEKKTFRKRRKQ